MYSTCRTLIQCLVYSLWHDKVKNIHQLPRTTLITWVISLKWYHLSDASFSSPKRPWILIIFDASSKYSFENNWDQHMLLETMCDGWFKWLEMVFVPMLVGPLIPLLMVSPSVSASTSLTLPLLLLSSTSMALASSGLLGQDPKSGSYNVQHFLVCLMSNDCKKSWHHSKTIMGWLYTHYMVHSMTSSFLGAAGDKSSCSNNSFKDCSLWLQGGIPPQMARHGKHIAISSGMSLPLFLSNVLACIPRVSYYLSVSICCSQCNYVQPLALAGINTKFLRQKNCCTRSPRILLHGAKACQQFQQSAVCRNVLTPSITFH